MKKARAIPSLLVLLAVPTAGCVAPALQVHDTNNEDIQVEHLFTHDGCKVFRFRDGGYHYFVKCDGAPAGVPTSQQTISTVSCGKGCARDEVVATEMAAPPR